MSLRRNALLAILLITLLAILGLWSASAELAHVWTLPAALLLLGLAYEAAAARRFSVRLDLTAPENWPLARERQVEFAFRQDARRSISIQAALAAPDEFAAAPCVRSLPLARGIAVAAALSASPRRLGRYRWPATPIRVGGPLGLAWWSRSLAADCTVTVVPDVFDRTKPASGDRRDGARRAGLAGAGTEILQLREYRRGDPLRFIDWKASARRGRLVSRDFSEEQHLEIVVAIDAGRASGLGAGELDRLGLYVNVAGRLAQRAAESSDAVGVLVYAAEPLSALPPASGGAAVARIRALLCACRVQSGESNPVLAAARIRSIARRRSLIVFLTDLEDDAAGESLAEAVKLLRPKHFAFVAGLRSARIAALPHATVRDPLGAYRALAAIEYDNAVAGNLRALRALGAAALAARPEHLDRAVLDAYEEFRRRRRV